MRHWKWLKKLFLRVRMLGGETILETHVGRLLRTLLNWAREPKPFPELTNSLLLFDNLTSTLLWFYTLEAKNECSEKLKFCKNVTKPKRRNWKMKWWKFIKMLVTFFEQISNENWFLTSKFALSERSRPLKHQKYGGQQYYVYKPVRKSKNILTISMFFLSPATLMTLPIDRSLSQLLRT